MNARALTKMESLITSLCESSGLSTDIAEACCNAYQQLTRQEERTDESARVNSCGGFEPLAVVNAIVMFVKLQPESVNSHDDLTDWLSHRLNTFQKPSEDTPSVWQIAMRRDKTATSVRDQLKQVLKEANPQSVLPAVTAAEVCNVCKSDKYLTYQSIHTRGADEPAIWNYSCNNPSHPDRVVKWSKR